MTQYEKLLGAAIGLAKTTVNYEHSDDLRIVLIKALSADKNAADATLSAITEELQKVKYSYSPSCQYCASPCGRTSDFDTDSIDHASEEGKLKDEIISLLNTMALRLQISGSNSVELLYEGLCSVGEELPAEELREYISRISYLK